METFFKIIVSSGFKFSITALGELIVFLIVTKYDVKRRNKSNNL